MIMQPGLRKAALVGHVTSSVGWLGAVAAFLVLAVVALHTADAATSRSLYVAMEVLGKAVLLPLAVASLVTGLVQSLGTPWGLFRHWWVIVKLALAVMSTLVLVAYTTTLTALADAARDPAGHLGVLPSSSPVLHSAAVVLVAATAPGNAGAGKRARWPSRSRRRLIAPAPACSHAECYPAVWQPRLSGRTAAVLSGSPVAASRTSRPGRGGVRRARNPAEPLVDDGVATADKGDLPVTAVSKATTRFAGVRATEREGTDHVPHPPRAGEAQRRQPDR